jgi:hypothetical protein
VKGPQSGRMMAAKVMKASEALFGGLPWNGHVLVRGIPKTLRILN